MGARRFLFTSESVTEGHPDKIADQISDGVLDAIFTHDPYGRVACETLVTTGLALVAGEITTTATIDFQKVVRDVVRHVGYTNAEYGFDAETCSVLTAVHEQSPDIAQGVLEGQGLHAEQGAGDQGLMFGYACDETPELMPMPIMLAHRIVKRLAEVRKNGTLPYLRPDGKSQVTVEYVDQRPLRVDTVVVAAQHDPRIALPQISEDILEQVVKPVIPPEMLDHQKVTYHINPTGRFVIGGPMGDCGLTGRKIIVDTYGGMACHGGGCFSGKDPTKVDRSASYMARYVAKNIVAAGVAKRCLVQLAYVIGVADPVSVMIDTDDTGQVDEETLVKVVREIFPLKPAGIIAHLELRRPIFRRTAAYGHFGRSEPEFTWERTDKAEELRKALGL
ncbi:MAG TPA: methionine adenosyltransferase [Alphaproteobacteria bacterium]|nr:methionine adenosyltransferase [Alphaproteobacteria bacterium]